jgi:hypothetical protein
MGIPSGAHGERERERPIFVSFRSPRDDMPRESGQRPPRTVFRSVSFFVFIYLVIKSVLLFPAA